MAYRGTNQTEIDELIARCEEKVVADLVAECVASLTPAERIAEHQGRIEYQEEERAAILARPFDADQVD